MAVRPEVPRIEDLSDLGVVVELSEQPGVVSVTSWAGDGSSVTLTWDEIAGSACVRWVDDGEERLVLERETLSKVSVSEEHGRVHYRVWCRSEGLGGDLFVRIGEQVFVRDSLLRT